MLLPDFDDPALIDAARRGADGSPRPPGPAASPTMDDARRMHALRQSFRWANGVVSIPTLLTFVRAGAFDRASGDFVAIADLSPAGGDRPLGTLWGALQLLALQGWLELRGHDHASRFRLTDIGREVVALLRAAPSLLPLLPRLVSALADIAPLVAGDAPAEAYAAIEDAVRLHADSWGLGPAATASAAGEELREALDGLLIGSVLVALDIGRFARDGHRIARTGPSIFEAWSEGGPRDGRLETIVKPLLLARALMTDDPPRLTPWGDLLRSIAAPFAGLGVSYLRSYAILDTIVFADPDPLGIGADRHIDRIVNIYASSGAGSGPLARTLLDKVVTPIFSRPFDAQPAGIADMGCGDGSALLRMARHIIDHTPRGAMLDRFPLVVIGADLNESARLVARSTLAALDGHPGVVARVVAADISDPDGYARAVLDLGLDMPATAPAPGRVKLGDLAHSFMFLLHNRRLAIDDDAEAERVFRRFCRDDAEVAAMRARFGTSFAGPGGLVSGFAAAADLMAMLERWRPYARQGFVAIEGHSPDPGDDNPRVAAGDDRRRVAAGDDDRRVAAGDDDRRVAAGDLPHVLNWGMHFISQQFMMSHRQFLTAMRLAGYAPVGGTHGALYPEALEGADTAPATRFFSVANYTPVATDARR